MSDAADTKRYMVRHVNGSKSGPLTKAALKSLAANGTVSPDDEITIEGSDKWLPAWRARGLFTDDRLAGYGKPVNTLHFSSQGSNSAPAQDDDPLATELHRLAALVKSGLITQSDYDEKKRRLLELTPSTNSEHEGVGYGLVDEPQEPQYWYMLGGDIAGIVEATGSSVNRVQSRQSAASVGRRIGGFLTTGACGTEPASVPRPGFRRRSCARRRRR